MAQLRVAGAARPVFLDPWTLDVRQDRVDLTQRLQDVLTLAARGEADQARALLAGLEDRYGKDRQVLFGRVAMRAMLGEHWDAFVQHAGQYKKVFLRAFDPPDAMLRGATSGMTLQIRLRNPTLHSHH